MPLVLNTHHDKGDNMIQTSLFIPNLPLSLANAGVGFPAVANSILDDTVCTSPWFASRDVFRQPLQATPFVQALRLRVSWPFAQMRYIFSTNRPDESTPKERRGDSESPDNRDVPGDTGRTGPNHRTPNWDSPGSGSGWEPGLGGSGSGNEPI